MSFYTCGSLFYALGKCQLDPITMDTYEQPFDALVSRPMLDLAEMTLDFELEHLKFDSLWCHTVFPTKFDQF